MKHELDLAEAGDKQLDDNQFVEARNSYRGALLGGADSTSVIHNLHVAEKEERDAFWRLAIEKFPENRTIRLARLEWRLFGGFAQLALLECTDLLKSAESPRELYRLRLARLRAASLCRKFDTFSEDFKAIWSDSISVSGRNALRRQLLSIIAELSATEAIPALEDLREVLPTGDVHELLSAKRLELLAICRLTS